MEIVPVVSKVAGAEAGAAVIGQLRTALGGRRPALLVCFASMRQPLGDVLAALAEVFPGVAIVGSTTAGEFTHEGEHEAAVIVTAVVGDVRAHATLVEGLKADVDAAAERAVKSLPPRAEGYPHRTAVLLFDGLAGVGEEVTLACANLLGADVPVAGGAAGDGWTLTGTRVGAGGRAAGDALALMVIDSRAPLGIGVAHGHKPLGARAKVTRVTGAVVHELDGQPAWKRYADLTRARATADHDVDPDAITDPGQRLRYFAWYQTGVQLPDGFKNRTPLARLEDGSMAYACAIPEGTEFEVLDSTVDAQIASARSAAEDSLRALGGRAPAGALVFECGCRKVYLGERFADAAAVVSRTLHGAPVGGFEAYGEVALNVGDFSGFHNATTVVLAFPRDEA